MTSARNETGYLFDIAPPAATDQRTERPFGAPGGYLGTSAFTANGWQGALVFAYANNHYAGHGPATVKLFWDLFEKR